MAAFVRNKLMMITLYVYHNIPSIVEWDPRRQVFHCCYG